MQRNPWKANHGSEQPCRLVTYDTESLQTEVEDTPGYKRHSFRLLVAHYWIRKGLNWRFQERVAFNKTGEWWDWLYSRCRPREPLWVYAHNHAFDFTLADGWGQLDSGAMRIVSAGRVYKDKSTGERRQARDWHGIVAVDNLPWILDAKCDAGKLRFTDSMNYCPVGLDKIAEWLGTEKLALPDEYDGDDAWLARCERDVTILDGFVMKLLNLWSGAYLGTWQPTIGGLAFSSFRHTSPDSGITGHGDEMATPEELAPFWIGRVPFPLDAHAVSALERRAYYGGRVAVGYVGDVTPDGLPPKWFGVDDMMPQRPCITGPVTELDVNGLYAFAMRHGTHPVELLHAYELTDVDELYKMAKEYPCIADVELWSPDSEWPCRIAGRTAYVTGRVRTTLAPAELAVALATGVVRRVFAAAFYHAGHPFDDYVDYWWGKRLEAQKQGDKLTARLCKLMLNALYGKLGQRRPTWQTNLEVASPVRWGPFAHSPEAGVPLTKYRAISGMVQEAGPRLDCYHTCTFLAASVTSWGRIVMEGLRAAAGYRQWLYQDTDSIFVRPGGLTNLANAMCIHPTELGKLKEVNTYDQLSIYGHKDYVKGDKTVCAGLKSKAQPDGERVWKQDVFERSNSIIARQPDGTLYSWSERFAPANRQAFVSVALDGWTEPVRMG